MFVARTDYKDHKRRNVDDLVCVSYTSNVVTKFLLNEGAGTEAALGSNR